MTGTDLDAAGFGAGFSFESLGEGYSVCVSAEHRFGTDAFLLAEFSAPRRKDSVCDLCSGNGIVALLMSEKLPSRENIRRGATGQGVQAALPFGEGIKRL